MGNFWLRTVTVLGGTLAVVVAVCAVLGRLQAGAIGLGLIFGIVLRNL